MMQGNGNGNEAVVIGTIPKVAKPGHREDYVIRIIQPTKKFPTPKVELRVWVDNRTSAPPYQGLSSRGGFFRMDIKTFQALVNMAPAVEEAYVNAMPEEGQEVSDGTVPGVPSMELLGGVTVKQQ